MIEIEIWLRIQKEGVLKENLSKKSMVSKNPFKRELKNRWLAPRRYEKRLWVWRIFWTWECHVEWPGYYIIRGIIKSFISYAFYAQLVSCKKWVPNNHVIFKKRSDKRITQNIETVGRFKIFLIFVKSYV